MVADSDLLSLKNALQVRQPNVEFSSSYDILAWRGPYETYKATGALTREIGSIFSIKYGEVLTNHAQLIHVL
jgi:hypothetical protein